MAAVAAAPSRTRVWVALWVVYIVWGSTYLAIRVVVHPSHGTGLPPLLAAGVRFGLAGLLMLAFTVARPAADGRPDPLGRRQWIAAAIVGTSLLLGGNGLVSLAEQRVASGPTAVIIATVPIWAALVGAISGQERVTPRHGTGLLLGFAGVAALVVGSGRGRADVTGVLVLVGAALSWAAGSVWSRTAPLARRPLVMTGMEMVCGGFACAVAGLVSGELGQLHLDRVPAQSWLAIGYLAIVGSMVGYTAYVWLLGNAPLSLVTTYAYVNPLVAVLLGALLLHEHLTARTAIATVAIVSGVALMVRGPRPRPVTPTVPAVEPAEPRQQCA